MNEANLARWHDRIGRAAALLAERLDTPPRLDELAAAACVSPYHFHRIWRGLTGETVGQTLARLRIDAAKPRLAAGTDSITGIAHDLGFGTSQSFARAFRSQTGMTPSAWTAQPDAVQENKIVEAPVRLVLRDGVKVVALHRVGGAYVALNALFQSVWDWAKAAGCLSDLKGLYGVPYDDPASIPESDLRYAACLAVRVVDPPAPYALIDLPAGPHAMVRNLGSYAHLDALTQQLVGEWLPRSGHEPADAPIYHHFHNDPEAVPEHELVTDILLPLLPAKE